MNRLWGLPDVPKIQTVHLYGYAVTSLSGKGPTVAEQTLLCRTAAESLYPGAIWGGCFEEPRLHNGALRMALHHRQAGMQLCRAVKPGDHVFIDELERISETFTHFKTTVTWFKKRRVGLHLLDVSRVCERGVDPLELICYILNEKGRIEQQFLRLKRQYEKAGYLEGGYFPVWRRPPFGTKLAITHHKMGKRAKERAHLVVDLAQRCILARIIEQYEVEHRTFTSIAASLEASWTCPAHASETDHFRPRDVVYLYDLGRFYNANEGVELRYLNIDLFPKFETTRIRTWQAPADVSLSEEQQAEIAMWRIHNVGRGRVPQEETYRWKKNRELCAKGLTTKAAREKRHAELAAIEAAARADSSGESEVDDFPSPFL